MQVKERILELIRTGVLATGDKLPGEPEIASGMGVSRMTANKAILALTAEGWLTREKGRGTFVAKAESGLSIRRCVVAIPEDPAMAQDNYYFGGLFWPIQGLLLSRGVRSEMVRLTAGMEAMTEAEALIVVNPPQTAIDEMLAFQRRLGPVVMLGASWDGYDLNSVDSDNVLGAVLAVEHLADLGHENILFLGACPDTSNTRDRVRGFEIACKARRIPHSEILMTPYARRFSPEVEAQLVQRLTSANPPTAIFAAGSHLAMQVQGFAQQMKLSVPDGLSVVGYDDPNFLSIAYPPITTVAQPLAQMAETACDVLANCLASGDHRPQRRLLDPALIIRGSTSEPPVQRRKQS